MFDIFFFFSSRRRHTRYWRDWSSDVCSSDLLLPKRLAMPVFCSDPLSSVAYATEEVLLVLSLGGLAALHLAWYVAVVIAVLLVVVVASCRQTCRAYPNGGGAYTVASANLGRSAGLAASALLVTYFPPVGCWAVAGAGPLPPARGVRAARAVAVFGGFWVLRRLMTWGGKGRRHPPVRSRTAPA